jgi:hypothetical protein
MLQSASLVTLYPYLIVHLRSLGFTIEDASIVNTVVPLADIIGPPAGKNRIEIQTKLTITYRTYRYKQKSTTTRQTRLVYERHSEIELRNLSSETYIGRWDRNIERKAENNKSTLKGKTKI